MKIFSELPEGSIVLKEANHWAKWFNPATGELLMLKNTKWGWKTQNWLYSKLNNSFFIRILDRNVNKKVLENPSDSLDPFTFIPEGYQVLNNHINTVYKIDNNKILLQNCITGYWKPVTFYENTLYYFFNKANHHLNNIIKEIGFEKDIKDSMNLTNFEIPSHYQQIPDTNYWVDMTTEFSVYSYKRTGLKLIKPTIRPYSSFWPLRIGHLTQKNIINLINSSKDPLWDFPEGAILLNEKIAFRYFDNTIQVFSKRWGIWTRLKPRINTGGKYWTISKNPHIGYSEKDLLKKLGIEEPLPEECIQLDTQPLAFRFINEKIEVFSNKTDIWKKITPYKTKGIEYWHMNGITYSKEFFLQKLGLNKVLPDGVKQIGDLPYFCLNENDLFEVWSLKTHTPRLIKPLSKWWRLDGKSYTKEKILGLLK
jgi:hypothetical protein